MPQCENGRFLNRRVRRQERWLAWLRPRGATALAVERATGTMVAPAFVAVLGAVCVGWSLITGLGIGLVFPVPSVLLLVAAAVSWGDRGRDAARSARG